MTQTLNFELVSPEKKLVDEPVYMAVIPGTEGELGVGPDHAAFIVSLQPGVVRLFHNKDDKHPQERIFIAGGFADITGQRCTVLAEQAINVNEMDKGALEQELKDRNEDLNLAEEDTDKARIRRQIDLVNKKLEALHP